MDDRIKAVRLNHEPGKPRYSVERFGITCARKAQRFHKTFPEYSMTPLMDLKDLARESGVGHIYVKDESFRFGLNAFKVLGGSYCIGSYMAKCLGQDISEVSCDILRSRETKKRLGNLTFVTATDGNHGRGIAWTANRLGQKSVVYMPKGSARERLEHIRELGAEASIKEFNYDDTVRYASEMAEKNGWILVQDTAWEGYEEIPGLIMEGYTTMALEAWKQLEGIKPTHIFLQAGVGAMAGTVAGFFSSLWPDEEKPVITIVEPNKADCIYHTAKADDGKLHKVKGAMDTIMAGLACGEPCLTGWNVLRDYGDWFISIPDRIAAKGMRILGNPVGNDPRIISGESGAATVGFVVEVLREKTLDLLKTELKLDRESHILCFSTEGDTDRENYRRIVWDGLYSG